MGRSADRKFGWIAGLALACSTAVIVPSVAAVAVALLAVTFLFF